MLNLGPALKPLPLTKETSLKETSFKTCDTGKLEYPGESLSQLFGMVPRTAWMETQAYNCGSLVQRDHKNTQEHARSN